MALLLGLAAAALSLSYLRRERAALQAEVGRLSGQTVGMVVAKRNLAKGDAVSAQTVAVREVPAEYAHSLAVTASQFDQIDGHLLAYPVKSGELILPSLLQGGGGTFSARVEPGRRAVTMSVDEISSISGLLEPGDLIDLMLTMSQSQRRALPLLVLQGVEVMATGQRSVNDPRTGETRRYSTVTLNTTPEQARNVLVAREMGKLTALLRNPQDKTVREGAEVDVASLIQPSQPAPVMGMRSVPSSPAPKDIPVLYGGNGSRTTQGRIATLRGSGVSASMSPEATTAAPGALPAPTPAR